MTKRITVAILLISWTILILGSAAAFFTARQTLLLLLDDSLIARASALLDYKLNAETPLEGLVPADDFYVLLDDAGQSLGSFHSSDRDTFHAIVLDKKFERIDGARYRIVTMRATPFNGNGKAMTIAYSRPAARFDLLLARLKLALLALGLFCGMASSLVALRVSRAALRPLTETAEVIADIDEKHLNRRIEVESLPPELIPMTRRLNDLLRRLETVFTQRRQFLADAAHELRTPTAALLTTLEVALRRPRDSAALTYALQSSLTDARLLRRLVDRLMEHARSDRLVDRSMLEDVDVSELLRECVETVDALAIEREVDVRRDFAGELRAMVPRDRLRSILMNLLSNAIEYNRAKGIVEIRCRRTDSALELTVRDTGQGIASQHLPHVFEPFYRGTRTRSQDSEHLGLGLFLVQSHVRALGGQCHIESRLDVGTTVVVSIPQEAQTAAASKLGETGEASTRSASRLSESWAAGAGL